MSDARLAGLVAVVTGAAQGIGRATALACAAAGARVWAVDRNGTALADLAGAAPSITTRTADVTDAAAVAEIAAATGPVGALVNCAGIVTMGSILDCTEAEWRETIEVNVTSMYRTIRAFLPGMLAAGAGSIVNVSSVVSSVRGVPGRFAYGTSKAAVIGLTKSVAADYVDRGIRCNAVCPGTVDTPSLADRLAAFADPEDARRAFIARQPMGRLGTPEEIAALILHLASPESSYTTGAVYLADGGMAL